jgi:hypothetical protein
MSDENRVSILICKDAGAASRTLLARADLRIRWALTKAEATAVVRHTKATVVVTRVALAKDVLAECAKVDRPVASVVLLEPAQWSSWREYFEAGATSVLRATAAEELLDAMTDATGVAFRTAPRVPFKTEVRFAEGGGAWTSLNLSATGLCIVDFPPYALGSDVDLVFEISGKEYEFNAIISQIFRVGPRRAVGLAFGELSPELQMTINEYTTRAQADTRLVTEPVEEFDALDENTLLKLRSSTVQGDTLQLIRALTTDGTVERSDEAAPWLVAACASLSPIEVDAIQSPKSSPQWAHDALLGRLRAFQARSRAGSGLPSEKDVREVFGLCQRLAESAANADDHALVQVTNIRGEILRALYDPELLVANEPL